MKWRFTSAWCSLILQTGQCYNNRGKSQPYASTVFILLGDWFLLRCVITGRQPTGSYRQYADAFLRALRSLGLWLEPKEETCSTQTFINCCWALLMDVMINYDTVLDDDDCLALHAKPWQKAKNEVYVNNNWWWSRHTDKRIEAYREPDLWNNPQYQPWACNQSFFLPSWDYEAISQKIISHPFIKTKNAKKSSPSSQSMGAIIGCWGLKAWLCTNIA